VWVALPASAKRLSSRPLGALANRPRVEVMTESWQSPERHSLRKSLLLHLAPGVPFSLAFLFVAWLMNRSGGSAYLAAILCIPFVLVPFEAGVLLLDRKRLGWSWSSLIVPRGSPNLSIFDIALSLTAIYVAAQVAAALAMPIRAAILAAMVQWLPPWAVLDGRLVGVTPSALWLGLFLSGLLAPIVEELYFRAYLLPRIPAAGPWAPAVNAALHSIYHFYTPWNYLSFFLAFLPLAYYVRLRGNILPTIIAHSLFNSVGVILVLTGGVLPR
jgi:CAAX protease family protein